MKLTLSFQDPENLSRWQYSHETLMICLLKNLQFNIILVTFANSLSTCFLICRIYMAQTTLFAEESQLLLTHLTINGEKCRSLTWSKTYFRSNKLL